MIFRIPYPLKPFIVTQGFGENVVDYKKLTGEIGHDGVDMVGVMGQPFYAVCDGRAYFEQDARGGLGVVLITKDMFDFCGEQVYFKLIYWHAKPDTIVCPPDGKPIEVKKGDLLGKCGATGVVLGIEGGDHAHLHFGVKPCVWDDTVFPPYYRNILQDNGFNGCVNPAKYWDMTYYDGTKDEVPIVIAPTFPDSNSTEERNAIIQMIINLCSKVVELIRQSIK